MPDITLKLELAAASQYPAGEAVHVTISLVNLTAEPLLINARMLANHEIAEGEVVFRIKDELENGFMRQALIDPADLRDDDFVVLQPGQHLHRSFDLKRLYAVKDVGRYRVEALYRNQVAWSQGGRTAWQGILGSNVVYFVLTC